MKIPCVYMRGGTSKGAVLLKSDLPEDRSVWDSIFIKVMGGPDPKQIDGLGGTASSNNKVIIVSPSERDDADVEYLVAQVVVGKPIVDYSANCGNMTSAVGPFSISSGLVAPREPFTDVRMFNLNTRRLIIESVPTRNGEVVEEGDCAIAGIDGTGAELKVDFRAPAGAKTGVLLPTGRALDEIEVEGLGAIRVSVVDLANLFVFLRGSDVGLRCDELPDRLNGDKALLDKLERIRGTVAQRLGMVSDWREAVTKTAGTPKLVIASPPLDYSDVAGATVRATDMDVCVRVVSVGQAHKACPLTGAVAIGGAAFIDGGILQSCLAAPLSGTTVRIGHPSGVMKVYVDYERRKDGISFGGIAGQRTARKIMDGFVYVRD